jgi:bisphosphoglycerate-dependent phosphoglycerate mutase
MSNKTRVGSSFLYNNKGRRLKTNAKIRRGSTFINIKLNNRYSRYKHYIAKNNNLKVYWIRHAPSCNNINSGLKNLFVGYNNPHIIKSAIEGSCAMGDKLHINNIKPDIVFCSPLIRAIQTAILMFPEKFKEGKIRIIPTLFERGFVGNKKDSKEETISMLKDWLQYILTNELVTKNTNFPNMVNCNKNLKDNELQKKLEKLYLWYNGRIFKKIKGTTEEKTIIPIANAISKYSEFIRPRGWNIFSPTVAIISHGNYLKKYIRKGMTKLKNNQIFFKDYYFNTEGKIEKKSTKTESSKLFNNGCKIKRSLFKDSTLKCNFKNREFILPISKKETKKICKREY